MIPSILNRRISRRAVALLCTAALIASLAPLFALAFYNHACYDDFGFSIITHEAWRQTGSVFAVIGAAWRNTVEIRNTWEGTYATSFISALHPAVFGEGMYFTVTFILLGCLLLSLGLFLRRVLICELNADRSAFWAVFSLAAFVIIQYLPDASEAFFWFNGGVAYTLVWSVMLMRLSAWFGFIAEKRRGRKAARFVLLLVLTLLVGGAKYSTLLLACLIDALVVLECFCRKRKERFPALAALIMLLVLFAFSAAAPGNAVRSATLGARLGVVKSVLQAFYFGLSLMGQWFSLPLAVLWALAAWMCAGSLQASRFSFKRPVWVTLLCVCLFCAQLAPTIYTGNYIGDGRTRDTYYYTYVLMSCALVLYWEGWFLRRREKPLDKCGGIRLAALIAALVVLAVGCVSYHPEGSLSYGPQNMTSGSALRSLLSGQAARYDAAMDARDSQMNDASISDAELAPVNDVPPVFMGDALTGGNLDYVLNLYAEYYGKQTVRLAEEEGYASQE